MSTTVYSQVLIYTAESTGPSWRELICPGFETVAKGGSKGRIQREDSRGGSKGRIQREDSKGGSKGRIQREDSKGGFKGRIQREDSKGGFKGRIQTYCESGTLPLSYRAAHKSCTCSLLNSASCVLIYF